MSSGITKLHAAGIHRCSRIVPFHAERAWSGLGLGLELGLGLGLELRLGLGLGLLGLEPRRARPACGALVLRNDGHPAIGLRDAIDDPLDLDERDG